jgi:phospholipase C
VFDHNDMHPPVVRPDNPSRDDVDPELDSAYSDMRAGEQLLGEVYTSIKHGASTTGSNAMNTVMLVTFDEHGGIYDHVAPPKATPPSGEPEAGEMGFTFDRLGLRVPTIVISAYTKAGSVTRLQAGGFASKADATRACASAGVPCVIVTP